MDTLYQDSVFPHHSTHTSRRPKPPCADHPDDWDLDVGSPETWHRAVETCGHCPLFDQCRELAIGLAAHGTPPRAMIWAGTGYDGSGHVVDNLDRHRAGPIERKRPLVIVRTGPEYRRDEEEPTVRQCDSTSTTLRRHIVLRRQPIAGVRTGTEDR